MNGRRDKRERVSERIGPHLSLREAGPTRQVNLHGSRSESGTVDSKVSEGIKSLSCHCNECTPSVVSQTFQMKLVRLEMYYRARTRERYAFECKAEPAMQVLQGEASLCYTTRALQ